MQQPRLTTLIAFLLIMLSSNAQTTLSGRIENLGKAPLTLFLNNHRGVDTTIRTQTNSEGEFLIESNITQDVNNARFLFYKGGLNLTLKPGFNLKVNFDADNYLQTLDFKGGGAHLNHYLFEKNQNFGVRKGTVMLQRMKTLTFESFHQEREHLQRSQLQFLNSFKQLTKHERELEKQTLEYEYSADLLRYFWVHDFYNKRFNSLNINPGILKQILTRCPAINVSEQSVNAVYINFLIEYFNTLYLCEKSSRSGKVQVESILTDDFPKFLKEKSDALLKGNTKVLYQKKILPKIEYLTAIHEPTKKRHLFSQIFKYFSNGKENPYPPLVHISDLDENLMITDISTHRENSLKESLETFQGKTIYLDFWTTWCRPCIASIPASNALQESMSNEEVVFINFCLGKNDRKINWLNIVAENDWKGQHYFFQTKDFLSGNINRFFSINGYPTYVIIDHNGYLHPSFNGPSNVKNTLEKYAELEKLKTQ